MYIRTYTVCVCIVCILAGVRLFILYIIMLFVGSYNIMSEVCEWETSVYMIVRVYLSVFVLSFQQWSECS